MNSQVRGKSIKSSRLRFHVVLMIFAVLFISSYGLKAYGAEPDNERLLFENVIINNEDKQELTGKDLAINSTVNHYGEQILKDESNSGVKDDSSSGTKLYYSGAQNLYNSAVSYYTQACDWAVISLNDESKAFSSILSGGSREEHATLYQKDSSKSYDTLIKGFAEHILTDESTSGSENDKGTTIEDYGYMKLFDQSIAYNTLLSGNGVVIAKDSSKLNNTTLLDDASLILKDDATAEDVTVESGSMLLSSGANISGEIVIKEKGKIVIVDGTVNSKADLKIDGGMLSFASGKEEFSYGFADKISGGEGFKSLEIGKLSGRGALVFNTDISRGEGDKLVVSDGSASGAFDVIVKNQGEEAETEYLKLIDLKDDEDNTATFELIGGEIDLKTGKYKLGLGKDIYYYDLDSLSDWYLYKVGRADIVDILIGSTALSFNEARFPDMRKRTGESAVYPDNSRIWFASYFDYAKINPENSNDFEQHVYDFQLGSDLWTSLGTFENHFGVFTEVGITDRKFSNGGYNKASSYEAGAYFTSIHNEGFYLDLIAKAGAVDNSVVSLYDSSEYWNYKALGSLEIGLKADGSEGAFFEPQVNLTGLYVGPSSITTAQNVEAEISESFSLVLKIGATLGTNLKLESGEVVTMYLRSSWENEIYTQRAKLELGEEIFEGESAETLVTLGAGFSLNAEIAQIYFGADRILGNIIENRWNFNLGARVNF